MNNQNNKTAYANHNIEKRLFGNSRNFSWYFSVFPAFSESFYADIL